MPTDDPRCSCRKVPFTKNEADVYIDCTLDGDYSQVPSFRPSDTIYWNIVIDGKSTSLTIQAGAFKWLKTKSILVKSDTKISIKPGAFSGVGVDIVVLSIRN